MSLHLTAEDARRLAAATEVLLSPLAGPSPEAWCLEAERRLRALFPGANAAFFVTGADGVRIHSESLAPDGLRALRAYAAADPRTGHWTTPRGPEVDVWLAWRRARRREVYGEAEGRDFYRRRGFDLARSAWFAEGLHPAGLHDFAGLFTEVPGRGELFVNVGYARPGQSRRGHDADLALLALLMPAYRAAHHALATFAGRRAAAAAAAAPDAGPAPAHALGLTPREAQVAAFLARRATDAEVAAALGVSWHTARRHAERVLQKLGVRSRTHVAAALHGGPPRGARPGPPGARAA